MAGIKKLGEFGYKAGIRNMASVSLNKKHV